MVKKYLVTYRNDTFKVPQVEGFNSQKEAIKFARQYVANGDNVENGNYRANITINPLHPAFDDDFYLEF
jgi:hypothetical protein